MISEGYEKLVLVGEVLLRAIGTSIKNLVFD
jgi:hypothetical protein